MQRTLKLLGLALCFLFGAFRLNAQDQAVQSDAAKETVVATCLLVTPKQASQQLLLWRRHWIGKGAAYTKEAYPEDQPEEIATEPLLSKTGLNRALSATVPL